MPRQASARWAAAWPAPPPLQITFLHLRIDKAWLFSGWFSQQLLMWTIWIFSLLYGRGAAVNIGMDIDYFLSICFCLFVNTLYHMSMSATWNSWWSFHWIQLRAAMDRGWGNIAFDAKQGGRGRWSCRKVGAWRGGGTDAWSTFHGKFWVKKRHYK